LAKSDYDFDWDDSGGYGDDEPKLSGEWFSNGAAIFWAYLQSLILAGAMTVVPAACILLDLFMGPQFIASWKATNGAPLTGLAWTVPYIVSFAMTGLQYTLFDRLRLVLHGQRATRKAVIMIVAVGTLAIADSILDVGGWTSTWWGDSAATNIIPPGAGWQWWVQAIVIFVLCMFHEPMMASLLARYEGHEADKAYRGAALVGGGLKVGQWILSISKGGGILVGGACMFILDLILTPQIATTTSGKIWMWIVSFITTALLWMLWEQVENVGWKRAKPLDRVYLGLAGILAVGDTVLDLMGFTTAVYGNGTSMILVPEHPTFIWALGAFIIVVLCIAGELMFKEMVWRPRKGGRGKSNSGWGSSDWDSGTKSRDHSDSDWDSSDWGSGDWDSGGKKDKGSGGNTPDWV
jgi:hypothetical protein